MKISERDDSRYWYAFGPKLLQDVGGMFTFWRVFDTNLSENRLQTNSRLGPAVAWVLSFGRHLDLHHFLLYRGTSPIRERPPS